MRGVLDSLLVLLWIILGLLLVTGGVRTPGFELAQLDVFALVALILSALRFRIYGSALPVRVPKLDPGKVVACALVALGLSTFFVLCFEYWALRSDAHDLGYVDQAIWTSAHFEGLLKSSMSKGDTYLGEHFSPILLTIAPLYRVVDATEVLFAVQALLLVAGGGLLWRLALREGLKANEAALLTVGYALYRPLRSGGTFSFREDLFFIPLLFVLLARIQKRDLWFWLSAIALLTVKENAPLVLALVAVWLAVKRRFVAAAALFSVAVAAFLTINLYVTPKFAQGASKTVLVNRLGEVGATPREIFETIVFHPLKAATLLFGPILEAKTFKYLWLVLGPFVLIMAWARSLSPAFVIALGLLAMNLLITTRVVGFHYELVLVPFLFAALVPAFKNLRHIKPSELTALVVLMFLSVFGRSPVLSIREAIPTAEQSCLRAALAAVPKDLSVASQGALQPHLSHRAVAPLAGPLSELKEDALILSPDPAYGRYATPHIHDEVAHWNGLGAKRPYRKLWDSKGLLIWCAEESCSKLSPVVEVLNSHRKCYDSGR